jgi:hypothetical protein
MSLVAVNWKPDARQLRWFGLFCVLGFGGLGTWIFLRQHVFGFELSTVAATRTAYALWSLGTVCGLTGLVAPTALRPLYVVLTALALPIGFVVSHVLMALIYYGLITPIGLYFRLRGRDPLKRKLDPQATSYWDAREPVRDRARYFRQF